MTRFAIVYALAADIQMVFYDDSDNLVWGWHDLKMTHWYHDFTTFEKSSAETNNAFRQRVNEYVKRYKQAHSL